MFVFSNLAMSVDGKIATSARGVTLLGSEADRRRMLEIRAECDAVLNGAETLRSFRKPNRVPEAEEQPHNVVLSSRFEGISPAWPFFKPNDIRRILLAGHGASPRKLKAFEKSSEVFVLSKPTRRSPVAAQALEILRKLGVERLLIEGGGGAMWEFASCDLIEELHVTLAPKLVGGSLAPTLVDGAGFGPKEIRSLKLVQCRVVGDELFLTYRRSG